IRCPPAACDRRLRCSAAARRREPRKREPDAVRPRILGTRRHRSLHEGSFVRKGIYDVDAFSAALAERVPENTLLSHDLFEGFYARTGLCTAIHLIDGHPSNYLAFASRLHRWVPGDWQIVRWLWRTVPDASGRATRNTLPAVARWKILDNLRRSLLPPAL